MHCPRDFEGFYAANFRELTMQLYAYCGSLTDAQDVVQEACCRALALWPKLSQYDDPAGWVRRVAWNLATSQWRSRRKLAAWTPDEDHGVAAPEPNADRVDLVSALSRLPERQRQAVVLHYLGDLSVEEIARVSQVPTGTVKSWMARARASLSTQLSEMEPIPAVTRGRGRTGTEALAPALGVLPRGTVEVLVTDPLADLFEAWRAEPSQQIDPPGLGDANQRLARWKRLLRSR